MRYLNFYKIQNFSVYLLQFKTRVKIKVNLAGQRGTRVRRKEGKGIWASKDFRNPNSLLNWIFSDRKKFYLRLCYLN